jgi:hypothetical protein
MEQSIQVGAQLIAPGRWLVETIPLLRFVPAWVPGAGFKRIAADIRERLTGIDRFAFNWTKEQIVRCVSPSHCALLVTDSLGVARNLGITLNHSPRWVFILMATN